MAQRPSPTSRRRSKDMTCSRSTPRCRRRSRAMRADGAALQLARMGRDARRAPRRTRSPTRPTGTRRRCARYDRRGERIDEVAFHPAWHELMRLAMARGRALRAVAYAANRRAGRARRDVLPACAGRERHAMPADDDVCERAGADAPCGDAAGCGRRLAAADPRATTTIRAPLPVAQKRSALIGMGMTERQGGSDVRANITRAEPDADGAWRITGHKWFFSAPQCDAHLVLAQTRRRPRLLPDAADRPGWQPQCDPHQPAEGQARQPLERVGRGRIRTRAGVAGRRAATAASRRSSRWCSTRGSIA